MSLVTQFFPLDETHRSVTGCPFNVIPPTVDQSRCASCGYNLAFPRRARVGCTVQTSDPSHDLAMEGLRDRSTSLFEEFSILRREHRFLGVGDTTFARRWIVLAETWYAEIERVPGNREEAELVMTIARFARACLAGHAVQILG